MHQRASDILVSSSAILDVASQSKLWAEDRPQYRQLPCSSSAFYGKIPKFPNFSSSTRTRRVNNFQVDYVPDEQGLFTPSEANLISMAREDIIFRRRFTRNEDKSEKFIFLSVACITIFFPLIGLLALCGRFDSTISWYTHGAMHALTNGQRSFLRKQILVEAILYPILIVVLAVYYSAVV